MPVSSNFYGSTQSRLKTYTNDRRVEERNGDIQQAKVYQKLAMERGDIETADRLAKLGMNIIGKIGATELPIVNKQGGVAKMSVKEHIMSMIEAGTLSNWWEAIKKIPPKNLSPKARIVQHDIKHSEILKEMINDKLQQIQLFHRSVAQKDPRMQVFTPSLSGTTTNIELEKQFLKKLYSPAVPSEVMKYIDELIKTIAGNATTMQELDTEAEKTMLTPESKGKTRSNSADSQADTIYTDYTTSTIGQSLDSVKQSLTDLIKTNIKAVEDNKINKKTLVALLAKMKDTDLSLLKKIIAENEDIKTYMINNLTIKPANKKLLGF